MDADLQNAIRNLDPTDAGAVIRLKSALTRASRIDCWGAQFLDALGIPWWGDLVISGQHAPLLMITGEMGSGKTTILDALATLPVKHKRISSFRRDELSGYRGLLLYAGERLAERSVQLRDSYYIGRRNMAFTNNGDSYTLMHAYPTLIVSARQIPSLMYETFRRSRER